MIVLRRRGTAGCSPPAAVSPEVPARVFTSLDELPGEEWRRATPDVFYFQTPFLEALARTRVEDAEYRYLLLGAPGSPEGAAVLSRFTLSLDLLSGDPVVRWLRRWTGDWLDVPMICCGVPASFGQHHLHTLDPLHRQRAFRQVDGAMRAWAERTGTGLLVWKEWGPGHGLRDAAREAGYVVLPTLPDHVVGPLPASISTFLTGVRSSYRRQFRAALELLETGRSGDMAVSVVPFGPERVADFFRGYRAVLDRAPVRLESYPESFFHELATGPLELRQVSVRHHPRGESVDALMLCGGATLWFLLVAKERERYAVDLYPTLVRFLVLWGIRNGCTRIRLGQTSSHVKQASGAVPERRETFIRLLGPWKHRLLRRFGSALFPETPPSSLRFFAASAAPGEEPTSPPTQESSRGS